MDQTNSEFQERLHDKRSRSLARPHRRLQADDLLLRSLSGLGDHILTSELETSLMALTVALNLDGRSQCAGAIEAAQRQLELTNGRINSRSTRTKARGDRSLPSD